MGSRLLTPMGNPLVRRLLGGQGSGPMGPIVTYNGATTAMLTSTSGTGGSVGKPSNTVDGDFLVLAVVARSAVTVPGGWNVLKFVTDAGTAQTLSLYGKQVSGAADRNNAISVTQATANPFNACIMGFRSSTGLANYSAGATLVQASDTSNVGTIPAYTPTANGCALAVCSTPFYPSGGVTGTPSAGWSPVYGSVFAGRQFLATRNAIKGAALGGTITPSWTTASAIFWLDADIVIVPV